MGELQLREECFDFTRLERRQRVGLGDLVLSAEFAFDRVDTKRRDLKILAHAVWLGVAVFDQPVHDLITSLRIQTHGFADDALRFRPEFWGAVGGLVESAEEFPPLLVVLFDRGHVGPLPLTKR